MFRKFFQFFRRFTWVLSTLLFNLRKFQKMTSKKYLPSTFKLLLQVLFDNEDTDIPPPTRNRIQRHKNKKHKIVKPSIHSLLLSEFKIRSRIRWILLISIKWYCFRYSSAQEVVNWYYKFESNVLGKIKFKHPFLNLLMNVKKKTL